MKKRTFEGLELSDRRVLLRADLDLPVDGVRATDDFRLRALLPTLRLLLADAARVILIGHRRNRKKDPLQPSQTMDPIHVALQELLEWHVFKLDTTIGIEAEDMVESLHPAQVLLLENLGFHPEEELCSGEFADSLSRLGDIFIDDDFADAHMHLASTVLVPERLPGYGGLLLANELNSIERARNAPPRPMSVVLGGEWKNSSQKALEAMVDRADTIILTGEFALPYLEASGAIHHSTTSHDLEAANSTLQALAGSRSRLLLPQDLIVVGRNGSRKEIPVAELTSGDLVGDLGSLTLEQYRKVLSESKTIVWYGLPGTPEVPLLDRGTITLAQMVDRHDTFSLVAGEAATWVRRLNHADRVDLLSTGDTSFLMGLAGERLPGVEALLDRSSA